MLLCLLLFSPAISRAQQDSTETTQTEDAAAKALKKAKRKAIYGDARKATIMSACFPGLGQIYNRKYWKAPIIYAAMGGLIYWGTDSQQQYEKYSNNLKLQVQYGYNNTLYNQDQLVILKNQYKKYRDYAIMGTALVYLLNVVDANVDAHLKTFDVSNDLGLQIKPYTDFGYKNTIHSGLTFRLTFK
ncbi:MAG: hypothetical protein JST26_01875 [Bacteroidetes bacterium]|nr:hypothetical protein [Bacteroidota bacterium]